jgi:hypothetical protein
MGAGVKLGIDPVAMDSSERGKRPTSPSLSCRSASQGQARGPLMASVVAEPLWYSEVGKAGHMGKGGSVSGSSEDGEEVDAE